jgi:hypothetical protein
MQDVEELRINYTGCVRPYDQLYRMWKTLGSIMQDVEELRINYTDVQDIRINYTGSGRP